MSRESGDGGKQCACLRRLSSHLLMPSSSRHAGSPLSIGSLSLSQHGISVPDRPLQPWSEIQQVKVNLEMRKVQIKRYDRWRVWYELPTWETPNASVLETLLPYVALGK